MNRHIARDGRCWFGLFLILVCFCGFLRSQPSPFAPRVESEFELEAFRDIQAESDLSVRLNLTESFLIRYPESELRHLVLGVRWNVFLSRGETAAVLGIAELALQAEIDFFDSKKASLEEPRTLPGFAQAQLAHDRVRVSLYRSLTEANNRQGSYREAVRFGELGLALQVEVWEAREERSNLTSPEYADALRVHRNHESFFLENLMSAHEGLGHSIQVAEYAERSLELDPDDLYTLITVSGVMAEDPSEDPGTRSEQMTSAEDYAIRAIEQVDALVRGQTGASMPPDQIARLRSSVHSTMGLVYFHQGRYEDAENEYLTAIESVPLDADTHYRLGVAYANDQRIDEALETLARSVYLNNPRAEARDALIRVYEVRYGDLEGMEEFIEAEGLALTGPK